MAPKGNPGDSADKGNAVPGYTRLPGGPNIQSKIGIVKYLRKNPGWVYKHRAWVRATIKDEAGLAGFEIGPRGTMMQYEGGRSGSRGRVLRQWLPKASATKAKYLSNNRDRPQVFVGGKKTDPKTGEADLTATHDRPPTPAAPVAAPVATPVADAEAQTGGGGFDLPEVDFSGLDKLDPRTQKIINPAMALSGAKLYGKGVAESQAGLQYDGQIQKLNDDIGKAPLETKQHVSDIGTWYGQVLASLKTAGARDREIGAAAVDSTVADTKAITSAIGGSANEGSGLVAAAGAQAAGTMGAINAAQDMYNQDLSPILQAEAAAQKTRESALGSSRLHDLQLAVAGATGQRGQAKAGAQFQVDQANNAILDAQLGRSLQIVQANNAARQGNFQNTYGIETTKLGAQVSGAKVAATLAGKVVTAGGKKKGPKPWALTPAASKKYAYDNFTGELSGNLDRYKADPNLLMNFTRNYVNRNGWSLKNPNVAAWVQNAYRDAGLQ